VKVFIDANVLVSVLNKEYPLFTYSSRVLSLADHPTFELYTSSLCLAIAFYFSSKKSGEQLAKKKMALLAEKLHLAVIDQHAVNQAIANPKVHDLEDGFQYYAAQACGCSCMITEDLDNFYFTEMDVLGSEAFLKRFVFPK
jgi:predicted nucleic acid-binding protein